MADSKADVDDAVSVEVGLAEGVAIEVVSDDDVELELEMVEEVVECEVGVGLPLNVALDELVWLPRVTVASLKVIVRSE